MPLRKEDEDFLKNVLSSVPLFAKSFLNKRSVEDIASKLPKSMLDSKLIDILGSKENIKTLLLNNQNEEFLNNVLLSNPFFGLSLLNDKNIDEFTSRLPESLLDSKLIDIIDFFKKNLG